MKKTAHVHPSDLRGFTHLATDAVAGLTDLVEAMHLTIARPPVIFGAPKGGRTCGITGLVYGSIRGVTRVVGGGVDAILAQLVPMLGGRDSSPEREAVLAALNGVLGDYLAASDNPLAIPMSLRSNGQTLVLETQAILAAIPRLSGKLVVLAHGLSTNDLQWNRKGHDHGAALARDLGYTPIYLHYNSGLHTSTNGRAFAGMLGTLLAQWPQPIEDFVMIAHSMGGLVARSACHYGTAAGHDWIKRLRKLIFLGTPHHGAPLERGGNWANIILGLTPYSAPFTRLGKIRSAGITDLRYGNLLDEDWEERDRFEKGPDTRRSVPLPDRASSYAIAATTGKERGDLKDRLMGDGLVPLNSALGRHVEPERSLPIPESRQWIGYSMSHLDLLNRPEVYDQIRQWLEKPEEPRPG